MKTAPFPAPSPVAMPERGKQPRTAQAAELIKQRIKSGIYKPGEQLPSMRALGLELGLSHPVIQRAVRQLEREAILETRHGVGIRILDEADCGGTALLFGFVQPYFSRFSIALQHYLESALDTRSNLCVMKSSHNDPARERREIERLLASGVNGLLLWPVDGDSNGEFLQEVSRRVPTVFVDRTLPGVNAPSVVLDYGGGARLMLRHLHQQGLKRVLVVCDPADISSYKELKAELHREAEKLRMDEVTFLDFPVIRLIEASYEGDYTLADEGYAHIAPLLRAGEYQAIFCPQSEFFDQVFADCDRTDALNGVRPVTMRIPHGPRHSRRYYALEIDEWIIDTARMLVLAIDLLQDMTLHRRAWRRTVRVPVFLRTSDTPN